ncbi:DUF6171 family protein [Enterococcus mediterraneensis]|uniref:DUF6171 family protein n=1 Tax=Enterococcus mediterraneensis TaxID=2364791 RepID=UPI000F062AF9|nr:DUF6171 family protein [Enterococcus mediterraneensis]
MSCKGCDIKETASSVNVDLLIEEQLSIEVDLAASDVVQKRIAICENCPFRLNHTCTKCGCFYKFRAHLSKKYCPAGMWEKILGKTGQISN